MLLITLLAIITLPKNFQQVDGIFPEVTASLSTKLNPYFVHALYYKLFKFWINWRFTLLLYAVQDTKIVAILWLRHLRAVLMISSQISLILFLAELFGRSFGSCKTGILWWSNCIALHPGNNFNWIFALLVQELNEPMINVFDILSVKRTTFFFFSTYCIMKCWN